jgi:hypothetical protein
MPTDRRGLVSCTWTQPGAPRTRGLGLSPVATSPLSERGHPAEPVSHSTASTWPTPTRPAMHGEPWDAQNRTIYMPQPAPLAQLRAARIRRSSKETPSPVTLRVHAGHRVTSRIRLHESCAGGCDCPSRSERGKLAHDELVRVIDHLSKLVVVDGAVQLHGVPVALVLVVAGGDRGEPGAQLGRKVRIAFEVHPARPFIERHEGEMRPPTLSRRRRHRDGPWCKLQARGVGHPDRRRLSRDDPLGNDDEADAARALTP